MRNFILHILTKVKNVPYISTVFFQFVLIIFVFVVLTSPANRLNLLKIC